MKFGKGRIILTIIFIWVLIGSIFAALKTGSPAAPVVVIILFIIAFLFPRNKKEVAKFEKKVLNGVDYTGAWGKLIGKTGAALTYHGGLIIKGTVEEFYTRIGGEEGAKRILNTLGKFSVGAGKICIEAGIVTGKVVVALTKYTMRRINQEMDQMKLSKSERKLLDEEVEWKIFDNDAEYTDFVNNDED